MHKIPWRRNPKLALAGLPTSEPYKMSTHRGLLDTCCNTNY